MKNLLPVFVRPELPKDHPAVFEVNLRAFGRSKEARLVELLRTTAKPLVSLLAVADERVVGHILFTPVRLESAPNRVAMGIGPLAVRPEYQRRGIGSRLIQVGLEACRIAAVDMVFALGEAGVYERHGFVPARNHGLVYMNASYASVCMVRELRLNALAGVRGIVRYRPEFELADSWQTDSQEQDQNRLVSGGANG